MRRCTIPECSGPIVARGWCNRHYLRWSKYGDPEGHAPPPDLAARFWSKVNVTTRCWEWTGTLHADGYGVFFGMGQVWLAHRLSYEIFRGPIPKDRVLDHLCRNRKCVKPDHLEPVTILENIRRGERATKTHCKSGHEFTPENTYISTDAKGRHARRCRTCGRRWTAEYLARKASG